jgi:hypothetical protein
VTHIYTKFHENLSTGSGVEMRLHTHMHKHSVVIKNYFLLGNYLIVPSSELKTLKMGQTISPEMFVFNFQS